ncbi:ABC transporter ATP-binding protein [Clostridium sp. DJ247]|uniref:ABC transporter ATP-binding protein n=1 Tax=Clostridium sp. DJ247 TaxID=2726188 RepID=UPI001628A510|nr:ABC transporter ATP-binding protein [Clostridium sp. DJ247]MBC2579761.1 ABC transporter ATP-binding protein [Clostridium sp. DJ247]
MSSVVVKNLYKSYEDQDLDRNYVLDDINFEAEENEFICILGKSGCGKSTLLNLLAGFIKPDKGEIHVAGKLVEKPSVDRGVVFQEHALFPWCTVLENVAFGPKLAGQKDAEELARKLIDMVGLKGYENNYPGSLSGGMAQRVGIARALATNPKLLLMDEPLGALDAMTRENMRTELLRIWKETKKTIIMITHSISEAVYLADRVIVLKKGRICFNEKIEIDRPRVASDDKFIHYAKLLENILLDTN